MIKKDYTINDIKPELLDDVSIHSTQTCHCVYRLDGVKYLLITSWEEITPKLATYYLQFNVDRNRNLIGVALAEYQSDMKDGQWISTHEGIAFDITGKLIDGQHRLNAIVNTGVSQLMLVTRGLPEKSLEVINRGRMRKIHHTLKILGYEYHDSRFVAVARRMLVGINSNAVFTESTYKKFIDNHIEAIAFAKSVISEKAGPAAVAAVIGRAFYHEDHDSLRRFGKAMGDQIDSLSTKSGDKSARMLKAFIDKVRVAKGYTATMNNEIYRKTQYALSKFLNGEDVSRVLEMAEELYELP